MPVAQAAAALSSQLLMVSKRVYMQFEKKELDAVAVLRKKGITEENKHNVAKLANVLMGYGDFKDSTRHFRILKDQVEQIQAIAYLLNQSCSSHGAGSRGFENEGGLKSKAELHTRQPQRIVPSHSPDSSGSQSGTRIACKKSVRGSVPSWQCNLKPKVDTVVCDKEISEIMLSFRNQQ